MDTKAKTLTKTVPGKFYAENDRVMKECDMRHYSDGSRELTLTVPVCEVWEHLKDRAEVAKMIAEALNAFNNRGP